MCAPHGPKSADFEAHNKQRIPLTSAFPRLDSLADNVLTPCRNRFYWAVVKSSLPFLKMSSQMTRGRLLHQTAAKVRDEASLGGRMDSINNLVQQVYRGGSYIRFQFSASPPGAPRYVPFTRPPIHIPPFFRVAPRQITFLPITNACIAFGCGVGRGHASTQPPLSNHSKW